MVRATTLTKLDASKNPKQLDLKIAQIDLTIVAGQLLENGAKIEDIKESLQQGEMKGIYQLSKNKLIYCLAAPGKPRPTTFSVPKDSGQTLVTLERFSTGEQAIAAKLKTFGAGFRKDAVGWITAINIQRKVIDKAAYEHVVKLSKLKTVYISSDSFNDADLARLAGMQSLQTLEIESQSITDKGLGHISKLTNLRTFYLLGSPVTDVGLTHLAKLRKLEVIKIDRSDSSAASVAALKNALPKCKIIVKRTTAP